ncbi:hypothetical protein T03_3669 [Trichinella britovi]|uniref:Uncharacterized protein n=1 Tax=Trichinella britovi TaxID=45882 RepID=A0A0V1C9S9_TRIBR|nr:hypothetical protein T03_3669 [Trichinella britovi]
MFSVCRLCCSLSPALLLEATGGRSSLKLPLLLGKYSSLPTRIRMWSAYSSALFDLVFWFIENYEEDWSSKDELVAETSKHDRLGGLGTCRITRSIGRVADGSKCQVVFFRSAKYSKVLLINQLDAERTSRPGIAKLFLSSTPYGSP